MFVGPLTGLGKTHRHTLPARQELCEEGVDFRLDRTQLVSVCENLFLHVGVEFVDEAGAEQLEVVEADAHHAVAHVREEPFERM